ncbi:MAG: hypothetical protein ACR2II_12700 [Chthoniobacterales bacterium]
MGRWLRHGYYPNWNQRLFRHSLGRYEKLTEVASVPTGKHSSRRRPIIVE